MSKERLKLVKSWGELRAGMVVVLKPCDVCGGRHRGMLVRLLRNVEWESCGKSGRCDVWSWLPTDKCGDGVTSTGVENRSLYRVVDPGLEDSDTYRRSIEADEDLAAVRAHQRKQERATEGRQ